MAFVDELTLYAQAGDGGDGVVRWRHEKGKEFSGPGGGDGGNGGDVYIKGVRDLNRLAKYRTDNKFIAESGEPGGNHSKHGKTGEDLYIEIPVGSIVTNKETEASIEVLQEGESYKLLEGGKGGFGNEYFKSSRNTTPKESTKGEKGQLGYFDVEVQIIADLGIVGFPNAGKTSLLNELTRAGAKVGDYPFTTLEPNLGVLYGFVLADIPGLIEGASLGKGLGHAFLRHIKRTRMLLHVISAEQEDVVGAYQLLRKELSHHSSLLEKKEIILLSKTDTVDQKTTEEKKKELASLPSEGVYAVSVYDDEALKKFKEDLVFLLKSTTKNNSL
ncbi:MAG: GTPase ObgE [Candidatus Paceibacterota bacterium]